jgi:hypothetical protein
MKKLADVLPESDGDAIKGLNILLRKVKVSRALKDYGLKEDDVEKAAEIAVRNPYWNPRVVEKEPITELLRRRTRKTRTSASICNLFPFRSSFNVERGRTRAHRQHSFVGYASRKPRISDVTQSARG